MGQFVIERFRLDSLLTSVKLRTHCPVIIDDALVTPCAWPDWRASSPFSAYWSFSYVLKVVFNPLRSHLRTDCRWTSRRSFFQKATIKVHEILLWRLKRSSRRWRSCVSFASLIDRRKSDSRPARTHRSPRLQRLITYQFPQFTVWPFPPYSSMKSIIILTAYFVVEPLTGRSSSFWFISDFSRSLTRSLTSDCCHFMQDIKWSYWYSSKLSSTCYFLFSWPIYLSVCCA